MSSDALKAAIGNTGRLAVSIDVSAPNRLPVAVAFNAATIDELTLCEWESVLADLINITKKARAAATAQTRMARLPMK